MRAATVIQLAWRALLHRRDLKHVLALKKRLAYFEPDGRRSLVVKDKGFVAAVAGAVGRHGGRKASLPPPPPPAKKVIYHKGVPYTVEEFKEKEFYDMAQWRPGMAGRGPAPPRSHTSLAAPKAVGPVRLSSHQPPRARSEARGSLPVKRTPPTKPKQPGVDVVALRAAQRAAVEALSHPNPRRAAGNKPAPPPPPHHEGRIVPVVYDANGRKHRVTEGVSPGLPVVRSGGGSGGPPSKPQPTRQGAPAGKLPTVFSTSPSKLPVPKWRVGAPHAGAAYAPEGVDIEAHLREQALKLKRSKKEVEDALYRLNAGVPLS